MDLGFRNYINLSLTGRVDKNSTFANFKEYILLSIRFIEFCIVRSDENAIFLPYVKLRASYANVGSGLTQAYIGPADRATGADVTGYGIDYQTVYGGPQYINSAAYSVVNAYNNQPSATYANSIANPQLKPSFSTSYEYGTDLRFFRNRVGIDATYFRSINGPSIFNLPISEASGYNSLVQNGIKTDKRR